MKKIGFIALALAVSVSSCNRKGCTDENALNYSEKAKKDDGTCTYFVLEIPATYVFTDEHGNNTVDYSGQTDRINQLDELISYLETGETSALNNAQIKDMFANTGDNGNGAFSFTSTKKLSDKFFAADTAIIRSYFDSITVASASFANTASQGNAGTLTSGTSTYLISANGFDYAEMIEKTIMGAVFLYQATQVYFGDSKMNVDNTTAVNHSGGQYYTQMEHHWDEAFGYFNVPIDFPTNVTGLNFWGKYCNSRDAQLGCNAIMMDAFKKGRTAIVNENVTLRNEAIATIRLMWEKIAAAQAVYYLQQAKANFGIDNAKYCHQMSEAYGFIQALKYVPLETRLITYAQISDLLTNTIGDNLWTVSQTDMTNAINTLTGIYGF